MRTIIALFIISALLFSQSSCLNDKADDLTLTCDSAFYINTIKSIFITRCYDPYNDGGCHSESTASERGNFSVYNGAEDGIGSRLQKIKFRINLPVTDPDFMPQSGPLSAEELKRLNDWLDAGGKYCNQ
jgi:hypothetical protein